MAVLEKAYEAVRGRGARVVFPEIDEPRVAEACARLRRQGLAEPVGLGPVSEAQIAALAANRGMKEGIARRMLTRPLIRAAAMVAAGEADAMVAGADSPTRMGPRRARGRTSPPRHGRRPVSLIHLFGCFLEPQCFG